MSRISKDLRANVKQGTRVPATIIDTFGGKASAKMLGNGALLRNLNVVGGPAKIGDAVYIDFTTSIPTIVTVGQAALTSSAVRRVTLASGGGGGGGGGVAPIEGPGIDLVGAKVGIGGDTILHYKTDGSPAAEFAASSAGLTAALAAMVSGDVVELPDQLIIGATWTVTHGILRGHSRFGSILRGELIVSADCIAENLSIVVNGSLPGTIIGINLIDNAIASHCFLSITNSVGDVYAIYSDPASVDDAYCYDLIIVANSGLGDAYCWVPGGVGNIYAIGGCVWASTSPIGVAP